MTRIASLKVGLLTLHVGSHWLTRQFPFFDLGLCQIGEAYVAVFCLMGFSIGLTWNEAALLCDTCANKGT